MKVHRYANIGGFFAFWGGIIAPSLLPILGPVFLICVVVSIITPNQDTPNRTRNKRPV